MNCGEGLLGYDLFDKVSNMFYNETITYEEYNRACCDVHYAEQLVSLYC